MEAQDKVQQFAHGLRVVRRRDGDTSYRRLSREMGYSISSISRVLNGRAFPRWNFTEEFLRACHVPEEHIIGRWHRRWQEIAELLRPIGEDAPFDDEIDPDESTPPQASMECPECGAQVLNPLRHQAWHLTYIRRDTRPSPAQAPSAGRTLRRVSG